MTAHHHDDSRRPATAEEEAIGAMAEFWNGYVEPWTPRVGDRVRCVPSPECKHVWLMEDEIGHAPAEYGVTGTVIPLPPGMQTPEQCAAMKSHRFAVQFDGDGLCIQGVWWWGSVYAAMELSPLDTPASGAAGRAAEDDG